MTVQKAQKGSGDKCSFLFPFTVGAGLVGVSPVDKLASFARVGTGVCFLLEIQAKQTL